jgi:voltage-gated potassium channel
MTKRASLYRALEPSARSTGISPLNVVIIILVLVSFLAFSLETEQTLPIELRANLSLLNFVILILFAAEYFLRIFVIGVDPKYKGFKGRIKYILTPYAIADFLAFAPELMATFLLSGDSKAVAALKAFRLLRLLKLARFVPAFGVLTGAFKRSGAQLAVALALAVALIYVSAILLYFVEGEVQPEAFGSIPRATWWAVATLTTVGYGDTYPITVLGKMFASVIALAGIGVVALPAGIFASAVSEEMEDREDAKKNKENAPETIE